ncbi:unnamed protein product [[Actinomadura] parvosata subsp. kistnae]|nr:unnamed protein product [Actinomadura parvosata subsp. kistnae]
MAWGRSGGGVRGVIVPHRPPCRRRDDAPRHRRSGRSVSEAARL